MCGTTPVLPPGTRPWPDHRPDAATPALKDGARAAPPDLVANRDNHLRNHGFLRTGDGWELSPAFDINPDPERATSAMPVIPGGGDLADVIGWSEAFFVRPTEAVAMLERVVSAVDTWRGRAALAGIDRREISLMASAFDGAPATQARELVRGARRNQRIGGPQGRVPRGVPAGGQYTTRPREAPDVSL